MRTIDTRSILLAMLPLAVTLVNYAIVRDLLWGILLGNKSKKTADRLKNEAKGWAKFSQRYMKDSITKYQKDYKVWMNTKVVLAVMTIVQLIGFIVMIALGVPFWVVSIICAVITIANVVLFALMMGQTATSTNKKNTKGSPWKYEQ